MPKLWAWLLWGDFGRQSCEDMLFIYLSLLVFRCCQDMLLCAFAMDILQGSDDIWSNHVESLAVISDTNRISLSSTTFQ
jgi:hypothetical protein